MAMAINWADPILAATHPAWLLRLAARRKNLGMTTDRRAGKKQGPYVAGGKLPRARNKDGRWRGKRSDAGTKREKPKGFLDGLFGK